MHNNIPAEMRSLHQWVVSGSSKIPFNPVTGVVASPTDPKTWGSFEEALRSGAPNIGFVLTEGDPFCIIDLDDKPSDPASEEQKSRQQAVLNHFDSYTELSTSSTDAHKGYHIVVKGKLPSGVNRDKIEMYSNARYIIMTGRVVKALPISDAYQPVLDAMYGQMRPEETVDLQDIDGVVDDMEIFEIATHAANSEKFNALCRGDIADYPSQSEADLALLSMLAYYSQDNEQVRRMFRSSALGKRDKAIKNDTYLNYALRKIRAKQPPPVDLSAILNNVMQATAPPAPIYKEVPVAPVVPPVPGVAALNLPPPLPAAPSPPPAAPFHGVTLPPGLIGEVAQYFYSSAQRPSPEIAMAGAIAFVAGIIGRSYNTSTRAGLSQYIVLISQTGTGKEAAAEGMSRLLMAVRAKIPSAMQFLGPSVFASGPALNRILAEKPCFVSVLGEFGVLLQKLAHKNANTADITLKRLLLDIYGKSGSDSILHASVYSDKEKDVASIRSPNVTILGETVPSSFWESLDEGAVTSGFLPRFLIIENDKPRTARNDSAGQPPSEQLLNKVAELVTIGLTTEANNTCLPVMENSEGKARLDAFDKKCDQMMNGTTSDAIMNIWNRAHLKALKLAALVAVGTNPHSPVVTPEAADWAIGMVTHDCDRLVARFAKGDIGEGEQKQTAEVIKVIQRYLETPIGDSAKVWATPAMFSVRLIPHMYLQRRTSNAAAFRNDKMGATIALKRTVEQLKDMGQLVEIDAKTLKEKFNFGGKAYGIGDRWGQ